MSDIKLNATSITNLKLGDTQVASVYLGNTLVWSSYTYLLNGFPSHHAQSLRKLYSTYTGNCLRVRRTTTALVTTIVDIGFDTNNTISLESPINAVTFGSTSAINLGQFAASTISGYTNPDSGNTSANQSIYVTIWYDQSGNGRDVARGTTAVNTGQPFIVTNGGLEMAGGQSAVRFSGIQYLTLTDTNISLLNISSYSVVTPTLQESNNSNLAGLRLGITDGINYYVVPQGAAFGYQIPQAFAVNDISRVANQAKLFSMIADGTVVFAYRDGSISAPTSGVIISNPGMASNAVVLGSGSVGLIGYISETFSLTGATSETNTLLIESNISERYSLWDNTYSGLCNTYPNPFHAYSLRRLRNNYTGPCFLARRTVGTITKNVFILFDSNNTISLDSPIVPRYTLVDTTLATNLGGFANSTGYGNPDGLTGGATINVIQWWDQSETYANDTTTGTNIIEKIANQSTATKQPILVSGGTLQTKDSKVALRFVKTNSNYLAVNDATGSLDNLSTYFVGAFSASTTINTGYALASVTGSKNFLFPFLSGTTTYFGYSTSTTAIVDTTGFTTSRKIWSLLSPSPLNGAVAQAWVNGSSKGTNTLISGADTTTVKIGIGGNSASTGTNFFDGFIQEIVCWPTLTTITSDAIRQAIESNINTYWNVY